MFIAADHRPSTRPLPIWCELPLDYRPTEVRVQWASNPWMQAQALRLRREVFCTEQGVFQGDDLDAIDARPDTRLLVACADLAGLPDEVVGTVRIHPEGEGLWWGSRLAVAAAWRRHGQLGSGLIRLAVGSAHALGCTRFLAHVQPQNEALFRRLHWQTLDEVQIHGLPHRLMQADLAHYPPCHTPWAGLVLAQRSHP